MGSAQGKTRAYMRSARLRFRLPLRVVALGACGAQAVACGQLLGFDRIEYEPWDGDASAQRDAAAPVNDGATADTSNSDASSPRYDAGTPVPVTIAFGSGAVRGLALDDTRVYWVTAGADASVLSVLKDGGGMTVIASGQPSPLDIAVQGTSVYWSVGSTGAGEHCLAMVASTPGSALGGADAGPSCSVTSPQSTLRMTLGGRGLVLLTQGNGREANKQYVGVAPPGVPFTSTQTQEPSSAVTATAQRAFLGSANGSVVDELALPGLTYGSAVCATNCGNQTIVDMTTDVAAANVLWITSGGSVRTAPITVGDAAGRSIADLGLAPATPAQRIARSATFLYATAGQSVIAVPLGPDAGASVALSKDENGAFGIAVDDAAVYWGDAAGTIWRRSVP